MDALDTLDPVVQMDCEPDNVEAFVKAVFVEEEDSLT